MGEHHVAPEAGRERDSLRALPGGATGRSLPSAGPIAVGPEGPVAIVHVVAGRSDAVVLAPVVRALDRSTAFRQVIVQIGRRAEDRACDGVFTALGCPECERLLRVVFSSPGASTAEVVAGVERVLLDERPVAVLLAGDDHATLGCALAAARLGVSVARIDAGLRSRDASRADELHRVLTDRLADVLFTHSLEALDNLLAEGIGAERVYHVGSTAIDTLRECERLARERRAWEALAVAPAEYVVVSLHRRINVDDRERLAAIVAALEELSRDHRVVLTLHQRLLARLCAGGGVVRLASAGVRCVLSQTYLDFLSLQAGAGAVLTDSGCVQEEASALGLTCFTFSATTERRITLTHGTNVLLGDDPEEIAQVRPSPRRTPAAIPLWDGHAAERVVEALVANYVLRRGGAPPVPQGYRSATSLRPWNASA